MNISNKKQHRALWDWLAKHPEKEKFNWPGHVRLEKAVARGARFVGKSAVDSNCFLCNEFSCSECPLCLIENKDCNHILGIYSKWKHSHNFAERTKLAIIIRDCWK